MKEKRRKDMRLWQRTSGGDGREKRKRDKSQKGNLKFLVCCARWVGVKLRSGREKEGKGMASKGWLVTKD